MAIWKRIGIAVAAFAVFLVALLGGLVKMHFSDEAKLFRAIARNETKTFLNLLKIVGVNVKVVDGRTPLMHAAGFGNVQIMKELLSHGANIDDMDDHGWTPLCFSASAERVEATSFLLENNAKTALTSSSSSPPSPSPSPSPSIPLVNSCAVLRAVEANRTEVLPLLLASGADPMCGNGGGAAAEIGGGSLWKNIPIFLAARNGYTVILNQLLTIRSSSSQQQQLQNTALDVNTRYVDGRSTPLMIAASQGHIECVKLLLSLGADVNIIDDDKRSALLYALVEDNTEIANILLEAGATPVNPKEYDLVSSTGAKTTSYSQQNGEDDGFEF